MQFGTREPFEYFSCAACETLQIVNPLEGDELMRHYPPNYHAYNVSAQPRALRWLIAQHDRFKLHTGGGLVGALIAKPLPEGIVHAVAGGDAVRMLGQLALERDARILDVGCGGGALLDRLASVGFNNLSGADPFIAADGETPLGVPLMKRYLREVTGEFELIMFNHSLEHIPDPVATLKVAYEKLAAGAICLVRLPTTSSEAWTTYGTHWVQIDAPRHVVIPSRRGMAIAADRAGLRVEMTFDDSTLGQFIGSEAYRRDVALTEPKILRMFGPKRIWDWEKHAERLNRQGRGDQTGFVLRAK
ncbi:class I SAM-dependent methyltransferase [Mycobacterium fragae]|uniref:Methyltransferase n=1 Tax=Mycobacterium fragae TaxID=1260918 RepID=A0A1X1UFF7_9MYCO|nr:class I SAM-dependent methyltransferase [Mycobacterium fragae]ORV55554.1 methyltransferase [Mycobacterium fragae]